MTDTYHAHKETITMIYEEDLDAVLREIIVHWGIPGMAVGTVEDDEIVYAEGFGVQSLETQAPVTMESMFSVCSISKSFVATAVVQLAECGKIDLNAPIIQYLPYFRMDDERYPQITIRQMLSHTSGMPDMDDDEFEELLAQTDWDDGCAERYVINRLCNKKLLANPGERFNYSDFNFNVLADMIAKIAGQTFETYMQEQILIPAGMPHSTFLLKNIPPNLEAMPHFRTPETKPMPVHPYHRAAAPASFLHSTIPDMCQWAMTSLRRGSFGGKNILSPAGYDKMWTPVAEYGYPRPSVYEDYGLGWTLGHFQDVKTVGHGGGGCGWVAFLILIPEKNRAGVFFCNEFSMGARYRILYAIANTLVDQKPQANKVSWIVPISQALMEGGVQAAYARYDDIKVSGKEAYYFNNEDDLISLGTQLASANKLDLAIGVLELNISVHPEYTESYIKLAKIYLQKGDFAQAEKSLLKALSIEPENITVVGLLEIVHVHQRSSHPTST
jgi:CubicO group peptidase (beta-lactamase class C family)